MFLRTLTTAACVFVPLASTALATSSQCLVAPYAADLVAERLTLDFNNDGIATLPSPSMVETTQGLGTALIRTNVVVGRLQSAGSVASGHTSTTVVDAHGTVLFTLHDDQAQTCLATEVPPVSNLCHRISITTSLLPAVNGVAPLILQQGLGDDRVAHFISGAEVDPVAWDQAIGDTFHWLRQAVSTTTVITTPVAASPEARAFWDLAGDVELAPYLTTLTLSADAQGTLKVTGRVHSTAFYNLVVQRLLAAGVTNLDPEMVIDTGLPPAQNFDPLVERCALD